MWWLIWLAISLSIMCFAIAEGRKIHARTSAYIGAGLIIMQPVCAIFPTPSLFFAQSLIWLAIAYQIRANTFPALAIFASGMCYIAGYVVSFSHIPFTNLAIASDLFGAAALLWIGGNLIGRRLKDVYDTNRINKFSADPTYSRSRSEIDNKRSQG